jgi:hypothetical protein
MTGGVSSSRYDRLGRTIFRHALGTPNLDTGYEYDGLDREIAVVDPYPFDYSWKSAVGQNEITSAAPVTGTHEANADKFSQ